jgi:GTPase
MDFLARFRSDLIIVTGFLFTFHRIAPIFMISSVTGENLDLLKTFLNILPPLQCSKEREQSIQDHAEMQVWNYPDWSMSNYMYF